MAFPPWLQTWSMCFEDCQTRRTRHRPASLKRATVKLRLERLEERLALSGFGPEDGSYIVEARPLGIYLDVKIQPTDQKIVAAGIPGTLPNGSVSDFGVARYDSLGNPDTSYGSGGLSSSTGAPGQHPSALVLQSDGKAVVAGEAFFPPGDWGLGLTRLNVDGSPDASFGSGGWTRLDIQPGSDEAGAVALQSTGKIVVAGRSTSSNDTQSDFLARFTASGALDSGTGGFGQVVLDQAKGYTLDTFGAPYNVFTDLTVQPDDKLVAVGATSHDFPFHYQLIVARYTATGTLDETFNGSGYTVLAPAGFSRMFGYDVAVQSDGKIVVAGDCDGIDGASDILVARFNASGTLDTTFAGGSGYVRLDIDGSASQTSETCQGKGLAIQPDGKIVVAGSERVPVGGVGGTARVLVARFNVNGMPDETFGTGGFRLGSPLPGTGYHDFRMEAVALQSDGSIIVAGLDYWGNDAATSHPLLMRFFGSTPQIGSFSASPNPVTAGALLTLTASNIADQNPNSSVTQVAFYRDSNGDGILQAGTDLLLGSGTQSSPGTWTRTLSTTGLTSGTYTFFAVALDNHGLQGVATTTENVVADNTPPDVTTQGRAAPPNQWLSISELFDTRDADGDPILSYQFFDATATAGSAQVYVDGGIGFAPANQEITVPAGNLAQVYLRTGSVQGNDLFYVRASDGHGYGAWQYFNFATRTANTLPTVTVQTWQSARDQWVRATDLFHAQDADGDRFTLYDFFDSTATTGSARLYLDAGIGYQPDNQDILVPWQKLANVYIRSGSTDASDLLWVRVHDGYSWSEWKALTFTTRLSNTLPVVTVQNASAAVNQFVIASSIFSVQDAEGDPVLLYDFFDSTAGASSAQLYIDGSSGLQPSNQDILVPWWNLSNVYIKSGSSTGNDTLWVRVNDGQGWSVWKPFTFETI